MADAGQTTDTHSKTIGYILWIFGFLGAHRFYTSRTWVFGKAECVSHVPGQGTETSNSLSYCEEP